MIIWIYDSLFFIFLESDMTCKIVQGYVITPIELGKGCFGTVYRGYVKENKN